MTINYSLLFSTLAIMSLSGFLSFFGCKGNTKPSRETINYPPFSIQKRTIVDRRFKPNEGYISKTRYTKYKIFHQDQLISFPEALDANTGVSGIWKAFYLKDAPTPTIIVASKNVCLVTEENNAAKISPIEKKFSNYASLQWLDSNDGQPGSKTEILIGEDTTDCILDGGHFLLINENTVLRVSDLSIFSFKKNTDYTDGYYAGETIAFSPDKDEIVFMGSKSLETDRTQYIHAMLVYNFKNNQAYTIPFNKTETRLHEPYQVTSGWVNTYFTWQQNEEGKYALIKKNLDLLPNWEGHFTKSLNYQLSPVDKDMHPTFFNFIKEHLQLKEEDIKTDQYGGLEEYVISHKGFIFNIVYLAKLNSVSFSLSFMNKGPEKEGKLIIKKAGEAFNEVLRKGEHQMLFSNY